MPKLFSKTIELEANSKPLWLKRLIASALDYVLLFFSAFLLFNLAYIAPISNNAKNYKNEYRAIEDEAKLTTGYGYRVDINKGEEGDYLLHFDEGNDQYYIVKNTKYASDEIKSAYKEIIKENEDYSSLKFYYQLNNYGILFGCGFISEAVFFFFVPLFNKRRATVGQLLCNLQLISIKRVDKAAWYQLLGRLFFIFFIESVIPYLIIGAWTMLAIPVITLIIRYFNKDNRSLYDFVTFSKLIESQTFVPLVEDEEE